VNLRVSYDYWPAYASRSPKSADISQLDFDSNSTLTIEVDCTPAGLFNQRLHFSRTRLEFAAWLETLSTWDGRIAETLALGETTGCESACFGRR
jgi:hypothetical protein